MKNESEVHTLEHSSASHQRNSLKSKISTKGRFLNY